VERPVSFSYLYVNVTYVLGKRTLLLCAESAAVFSLFRSEIGRFYSEAVLRFSVASKKIFRLWLLWIQTVIHHSSDLTLSGCEAGTKIWRLRGAFPILNPSSRQWSQI